MEPDSDQKLTGSVAEIMRRLLYQANTRRAYKTGQFNDPSAARLCGNNACWVISQIDFNHLVHEVAYHEIKPTSDQGCEYLGIPILVRAPANAESCIELAAVEMRTVIDCG